MSARSRPPTDEVKTEVFDSAQPRTRLDKPRARGGTKPNPPVEPRARGGTKPNPPVEPRARGGTKPNPPVGVTDRTEPQPALGGAARTEPQPALGGAARTEPKPPVLPVGVLDRTEPMKVISMKTPAQIAAERGVHQQPLVRPPAPKPQLRSVAEVRKRVVTPPHGLGNFAPPRDAKEARGRLWWSNTFWGSVAVIIASLVALVIWLIAGRR